MAAASATAEEDAGTADEGGAGGEDGEAGEAGRKTGKRKGTRRHRHLLVVDLNGRGLHSFTSQLNLSRFGHTSPCPPV